MVDSNDKGYLYCEEFVLGMYFIDKKRSSSHYKIPKEISFTLMKLSKKLVSNYNQSNTKSLKLKYDKNESTLYDSMTTKEDLKYSDIFISIPKNNNEFINSKISS